MSERTPAGGWGLSEQERRVLAELEERLVAEDSRLDRRMRVKPRSTLLQVLQTLLLPLGLVLMVTGVALDSGGGTLLGVLGYLVMFAGGLGLWGLVSGRTGERRPRERRRKSKV